MLATPARAGTLEPAAPAFFSPFSPLYAKALKRPAQVPMSRFEQPVRVREREVLTAAGPFS